MEAVFTSRDLSVFSGDEGDNGGRPYSVRVRRLLAARIDGVNATRYM